jgi:hypothetical protein
MCTATHTSWSKFPLFHCPISLEFSHDLLSQNVKYHCCMLHTQPRWDILGLLYHTRLLHVIFFICYRNMTILSTWTSTCDVRQLSCGCNAWRTAQGSLSWCSVTHLCVRIWGMCLTSDCLYKLHGLAWHALFTSVRCWRESDSAYIDL